MHKHRDLLVDPCQCMPALRTRMYAPSSCSSTVATTRSRSDRTDVGDSSAEGAYIRFRSSDANVQLGFPFQLSITQIATITISISSRLAQLHRRRLAAMQADGQLHGLLVLLLDQHVARVPAHMAGYIKQQYLRFR